jgi:hypothetical protein
MRMTKIIFGSFVLLLVLAKRSPAADLSKYRDFQLGTTLSAVVMQTGGEVQPKTLHSRPALIQQLAWRPRSLGPSTQMEAVEDVTFTFYEGSLFRIMVRYDRYQTEGMTSADLVEAISAAYGQPLAPPAAKVTPDPGAYSDAAEVIARWEDAANSFELVRTSYGPSYKLTGSVKAIEAKAAATELEARRLDEQEAPQRDAARIVAEEASAKDKLDKARLVNKPKFRP